MHDAYLQTFNKFSAEAGSVTWEKFNELGVRLQVHAGYQPGKVCDQVSTFLPTDYQQRSPGSLIFNFDSVAFNQLRMTNGA